jgi:hypothetical protein
MLLSCVINQLATKVDWLQRVKKMRNASFVCHKSASDKGALVAMCGRDEECFSHVS